MRVDHRIEKHSGDSDHVPGSGDGRCNGIGPLDETNQEVKAKSYTDSTGTDAVSIRSA